MENRLWTIVKTGILGNYGINTLRFEKDRTKRGRAIGLALAYLLVGIVMAGYCFALSFGLGFMGLGEIVPGYALTITSIVTLLFTFLKTNGVLFGSKDYDMLMAYPIRTTTVITAKFISLYINNLIFAAIVMIPMAVGHCIWCDFGVGTIVMWFAGILLTPLLPMTIAATAGLLIAGIGSGFRHKVLAQVILTVGLLIGIFGASFWAQDQAMRDEAAFVTMLTDLGATLSDTIHGIYPLSTWFDGAIAHGNVLDFFLFAGVSVGIYILFAIICGKCYRKINTALKSHHAAANYELGELKTSSVYMALVKKEAKRFTSSTVYMTNVGIGLLLALILAVASIFVGVDTILDGMELPNAGDIRPMIGMLAPFAVAMIVNMCNTTSVSLSLEGANLWVVQSLPITKKTLLQGKMLFNIMLVLPVSVVCNIIFAFVLKVNAGYAVCYLIFAVISVLFSTVLGMWINLHFPNFIWENEVQIVKQSASSMLGIFSGMIGYLVLGGVAFGLARILPGELVLLVISVALVLFAIPMYRRCK